MISDMDRYIFAFFMILSLAVSSCTKVEETYLQIIDKSFNVPVGGGTYEVHIGSNERWAVSSDCSWIGYVYPDDFTDNSVLLVDIGQNDSGNEREGKLTISVSGFSETVVFVQNGEDTIIISEHVMYVPAEGGNIAVEVMSNISYGYRIAEDVDWISEVATKSLSETLYTFHVESNPGYDRREACIIFESEDGISDEVKVIQETSNKVLRICHDRDFFTLPVFGGQDISGKVDWGDGVLEQYGISSGHDYDNLRWKYVTVSLSDAESFRIENLDGISVIDISRF